MLEVDDVVGPLPDEQGVLDGRGVGAEHPERLIAHLPAVAVGAVEEVLAPPFPDAGDVGEVVAHAGGDQHAPGAEDGAAGRVDREAWVDSLHVVVDDLDAVAADLVPASGEELGRGHAVT